MRWRTRNREVDEETAIRCLAHGIAHGRVALGDRRLATVLGTIALDLAGPAGTTVGRGSDSVARS